MRKEVLLAIVSASISLAIGLGAVRFFAPTLISPNTPSDLRIVMLDKKIPPFYDNIFRSEDILSTDMLLNDPVTVVRGKPFFPVVPGIGPHDILGFRNREVPYTADVVVIGDSQTYGNNVLLRDAFPSVLEERLSQKSARVYSMATGGWSGPQYLDIFTKSVVFQPRVVVIAFYSGNDASEAFRTAYAVEKWKDLRLDEELGIEDLSGLRGGPDR